MLLRNICPSANTSQGFIQDFCLGGGGGRNVFGIAKIFLGESGGMLPPLPKFLAALLVCGYV